MNPVQEVAAIDKELYENYEETMKNFLDKPIGNPLESDDFPAIRNPFSPEYHPIQSRIDTPNLLEPQLVDELDKKSLDDDDIDDDEEEDGSVSQRGRKNKLERSSKRGTNKGADISETPDKGDDKVGDMGSSPRPERRGHSGKRKQENKDDTEERGSEADQQSEKSYFRNAICHICREKKIVYGCYYNFKLASCSKVYCEKCLKDVFQEKLSEIIKNSDWKCPFKKKLCKCVRCEKLKERNMRELMHRQMVQAQETENKPHPSLSNPLDIVAPAIVGVAGMPNLGLGAVPTGINQNKLIKQHQQTKIRNLLDFNGTLITKVSKYESSMKIEETLFYHKIIYDNLKKLEKLCDFIQDNQLAIKE